MKSAKEALIVATQTQVECVEFSKNSLSILLKKLRKLKAECEKEEEGEIDKFIESTIKEIANKEYDIKLFTMLTEMMDSMGR